jgi:two-component system KDP operon response regulator KdpE
MKQPTARVLIVDDEPQIRRFLRTTLHAHEYGVVEAATGREALRCAADARPDIVILDLGLPDMDGLDVLSKIREWSSVPVIVLTVRGDERDKIAALDKGADDYVTKPFGSGELLARMRVALRHRAQEESDDPLFQTGALVVDLGHRRVTLAGAEVRLTPKEYDILRLMVLHPGRVLTHQFLLREVWGPTYVGQSHYVRVFIGTLRQKIEPDPTQPRYILTEPGVGYRLQVLD